ncbi:MAG: ABC transporter substrate-binding protein [Pseudomonadota bacterium]
MKSTMFAACLAAAPLLVAASQATAAEANCDGIDRPIVLAGLDWDSNSLQNGIIGFILEHGYGCEIDQIPGSTIPLLNGMIRGDIDITMEMWIPNVAEAWGKAVADGDVAAVGISYPDATQAWYVPKYLVDGDNAPAPDLKSVSDLPKYAELFEDAEEPDKGRFYNCILGWGCEVMNSKKLIAYDLSENYTNFRPGTGGALAAAIESAILRERPIVFYYWSPTWVMGKVGEQVVQLEEPAYNDAAWKKLSDIDLDDVEPGMEATAWPLTEVSIAVNSEFKGQAPTIVELLGKYGLTAAKLSEGLAHMQDEDASADEAAIWWMQNTDEWKAWLSDEAAERVSAALASS